MYNFDLPDGKGFVSMSSSEGMEEIQKANEELQGKDLLSHAVLTYQKFEPLEDGRDGVRISTVINVDVDPTGWLPDFVLK